MKFNKIKIIGLLITLSISSLAILPIIACSNSNQTNNPSDNKPKPPIDNSITNNELNQKIINQIGSYNLYATKLNVSINEFNDQLLNDLIKTSDLWTKINQSVNELNQTLTNKIDINKLQFLIGNHLNNNSLYVNLKYDNSNSMQSQIIVLDLTKVNPNDVYYQSDFGINKTYYLNEINNNIESFIQLKNNFDTNLDLLTKNLINILHSFVNLNQFYPNEYKSLNLNQLNLNDNQLNKLIINMENKYFLQISNFCFFENLIFNFNNNLLDSISISSISNEFNSFYYKKLLSEFIYNGLILIDSKMSQLEKLIIISQYICDFINADQNPYENIQLYSVLETRNGVCRHYVQFLTMFLNILGINNYTMIGNAFDNNQSVGYHIWNMVEINNQWLAIDLIASDRSASQVWQQNHSSSPMTFKNYFLKGKKDNNRWQVFNSTFQRNPAVSDSNNSQDLNAYINDNSSFLYRDLWSENSYDFIFKDLNQSNLASINYYKNYWYTLAEDNINKQYQLWKIDLKTNQKEIIWKFASDKQVWINFQSTINFKNLYIFKLTQNNQTKLVYFDLNNPTILNEFKITNLNANSSLYISNNQLIDTLNQQILISDLNQIAPVNKPIDDNIMNLVYSSIGQIYQSATSIGNEYSQINIDNISAFKQPITNQSELNNFINQIKHNESKLVIKQDLMTNFTINADEYFNELIGQYSYLRFNFQVEYENTQFNFDQPSIKYQWFLNDNLYSESINQSYIMFDNLKTKEDLNQLVGNWYCIATNLVNNQSIKSSTMNFNISEQKQYLYPPYYLTLTTNNNSFNSKDLDISLKDIAVLDQTQLSYQIIKNNQIIKEDNLINNQSIKYTKNYQYLLNSDYGLYEIKLIFKANQKQLIQSYFYHLYKLVD